MCQKLWKLTGSRQSYCKNYLAYFFLLRKSFHDTVCVPEKSKPFIFDITSPSVELFFTVFGAFCSGIISACCSLLRTHHRREAFTWRNIMTLVELLRALQALLFIPPE